MASNVETIFTSPKFFGVPATPVQRAWCRVADGEPLGELWDDPAVRRCFGNVLPPAVRPREVVGCAGDRTGKSMILASIAIERARFSNLGTAFRHEQPPIIPIVSILKANAKVVLGHIVTLMSESHLRGSLIGEPTAETCTIRNQSGLPIKIKIVANRRAAGSLASTWHVCDLIDEVFLSPGADESSINLDVLRVMVLKRLIPGGQIFEFGTPWAPTGPGYALLEEYFGRPTSQCVAMHTDGPSMNPVQWTPEFCEELRTSKDQSKQDAYVTGACGEFLGAIGGMLTDAEIRACWAAPDPERKILDGYEWQPPDPDRIYTATMDPAARRNAWTMLVTHREGERLIVDFADQWVPQGGVVLDPDAVMADLAKVFERYRISMVYSDQWSSEALGALGRHHGVEVVRHELAGKTLQDAYQAVVDGVKYQRCQLPRISEMRRDLLNLKRRVTMGRPNLFLAQTPDGRHADFVPPIALAWILAVDQQRRVAPMRLSRRLLGDEDDAPVRRPEDTAGVLLPAEHPALDELFR